MNDEDSPRRMGRIASACIAITFCLPGCHASAPPLPAPTAPIETADRHIVSGAALRQIMQRLESLMHDRVQADLALDATRMREADKLAAAAGELAIVAESISPAAVGGTLDDAARQRFDAYARELAREAEVLREVAAGAQFVQSAAQFERLTHACAGCHSLYRAR